MAAQRVRGERSPSARRAATGAAACFLAGVVTSIYSYGLYHHGSTVPYGPHSRYDAGSIAVSVPYEKLQAGVALSIYDTGKAAYFQLVLTITSTAHLDVPPTAVVAFQGGSRVAVTKPLPISRLLPLPADWVDWWDEDGTQTLRVTSPGNSLVPTVQEPYWRTDSGSESGFGVAGIDSGTGRVPVYTFDGFTTTVRISGQFLSGSRYLRQGARQSLQLPVLAPARFVPEQSTAAGAMDPTTGQPIGTDPHAITTTLSVDYLQPVDAPGGGQYASTDRIGADQRIDYEVPDPEQPDMMTWRRQGDTGTLEVQLSMVTRSLEEQGQSDVFIAGIGLGAAISLALLGFQVAPWNAMLDYVRESLRYFRKEISR